MENRVDNPVTHELKNKYNRELLSIKRKAKIIESEAYEIRRIVDTATRIAIATGGLKKTNVRTHS